jgi:hypothetical protein
MNLEILKKFKAPQAKINQIAKAIEKQGYTGDKETKDIKVLFKLFNPVGAGTWFVYEIEDGNIAWCFANLGDPTFAECGTVSFDELAGLRLPMGLTIELDRHFPIGETSLADVIKKVQG